jgi:TolB-like protein
VWRIAIAYVVTAWVLLQLASIVLPGFGAPGWVLKALIVVFVILFPIALIMAWALEITPEGVRRTVPASAADARVVQDTRAIGRKLNTGIIVALVIAVLLLLGNQFFWHKRLRNVAPSARPAMASSPAAPAARAPETAPAIPTRSIAVLPFENLSGDKDNAYFAGGIQDLVLTKLADIGSLKVISRTSTEKYKSRPDNLKQVAAELGVATILEGSVQKQGDQVLINVQLIDAKTDSHIWAKAYTKTLTNVFGVEGEVAEAIATSLNAKLTPVQSKDLAAAPTTNRAAYDAFLRAEYLANRGSIDYGTGAGLSDLKAAIPLYREAVQADPGFALAWARLSYSESQLAWEGGAARTSGSSTRKRVPTPNRH